MTLPTLGLHDHIGEFECTPYIGDNTLYQNGALKISDDRRRFAHNNGQPFFWLADTAWNGVLRANAADWDHYLDMRRMQNFTVLQFVATAWKGSTTDPFDETERTASDPLRINPAFFQRLDPKVSAINERGMIASPVMLWANEPHDPGLALSVEDCITLARYIQARWGAFQVVWILGGDSRYASPEDARWRKIAEAVFSTTPRRLVTTHPVGANWSPSAFWSDPWFDFIGYQSGHAASERHLQWLTSGPPATDWRVEPAKPIVNLEPNYEYHPARETGRYFTDFHVRRATYWSLLGAPTAGITLGVNPIWVWREDVGPAEGHHRLDTVMPWYYGLDTPGVRSMTAAKEIFSQMPWWTFRPASEALSEQPGERDLTRFVVVAAGEDKQNILAYSPAGDPIALRPEAITQTARYRWIDPRTGVASDIKPIEGGRFHTPDKRDWLLHLSK